MFIVLELNQDEFGHGNSRPVHKFDTEEETIDFCKTYRGNTSRLEVFLAEPLLFRVSLER